MRRDLALDDQCGEEVEHHKQNRQNKDVSEEAVEWFHLDAVHLEIIINVIKPIDAVRLYRQNGFKPTSMYFELLVEPETCGISTHILPVYHHIGE